MAGVSDDQVTSVCGHWLVSFPISDFLLAFSRDLPLSFVK